VNTGGVSKAAKGGVFRRCEDVHAWHERTCADWGNARFGVKDSSKKVIDICISSLTQ